MAAEHLISLNIRGYRPFRDADVTFGPLEVFVGANGTGKSSLFEFLRFLRDGVYQEMPPEIVAGLTGQRIFHSPGPERFAWKAKIDLGQRYPVMYQGEVAGPLGKPRVSFERVGTAPPDESGLKPIVFMDVREQRGSMRDLPPGEPRDAGLEAWMRDQYQGQWIGQELTLNRWNELALHATTNPAMVTPYNLREYIARWRFYDSFRMATEKQRKSVLLEQEPLLHEHCGNLSSVLGYLSMEHPDSFQELEECLRLAVPGFKRMGVKPRGAPGEVIAFWSEGGVDEELSLADLSDGIVRLLCWLALCVHPTPPSLICIDEPDQGLHPRIAPLLAGMFERACERTQILLATHSSYFLRQFDLSRITVVKKEEGHARFLKPSDRAALTAQLEEFGADEIEAMHRSDELEALV